MSKQTTDRAAGGAERRRGGPVKKILIGVVALIVLLVGAVLLLGPSIAGSMVPGLAGGAVNKGIQGRLDLSGVKLSWGGPQKVERILLKDPSGRTVADVSASIDAGLIGLATGSLNLGKVHLSGELDVVADKQGRTNLEAALEPSAAAKAAKQAAKPTPAQQRPGKGVSEPFRIPDGLAVDLDVDALQVKFTGAIGPGGEVRTIGLRDITAKGALAAGKPLALTLGAKTLDGKEALDGVIKADRLTDASGRLDLKTAKLEALLDATLPAEYVEMLAAGLVKGGAAQTPAVNEEPARLRLNLVSKDGRLVMGEPANPPFARLRVPAAVAAALSSGDIKVELDQRPLVTLTLSELDLPLPAAATGGSPGGGMDFRGAKIIATLETEAVRGRVAGSLPADLVELAVWMAGYYVCPLGMVLAAMTPAASTSQRRASGSMIRTSMRAASRLASRSPIRPPPASITRRTGRSILRSSVITVRMCSVAASTNTSSPGSMRVWPVRSASAWSWR
jgi:hypothetical protein